MPDTKITALTAISTVDPAVDVLPIVDVSDTTMAASGTTKKITSNQILGAGGTATLASATITGDLTVDTSTLKVDSTNNRVGIGTASPAHLLDILATGASTATSSFAMARITGASAVANDLTLIGPNTSQVRINFGDVDSSSVGEVGYDHSTNRMRFVVSGNEQYRIDPSGVFTWYDGAGGTRMTLNTTGLGVGVTPSAWWSSTKALQISNSLALAGRTDTAGRNYLASNAYLNSTPAWTYIASSTAAARYDQNDGSHQWHIAPSSGVSGAGTAITFTQAMTLDASGNLLVGTTAQPSGVTGSKGTFKSTASDWTSVLWNSNAAPFGLRIQHDTDVNGSSNQFLFCYAGSTTRAEIRSNGGLANYQANNVNLSDARTKTDIKPLDSYWNKIKALELVTFKYKDQTHSDDNIGLIAQQVESVAPELIDADGFGETPADGVPLKTIYTTDLYHASIKALQEAMARIEALEAKLT